MSEWSVEEHRTAGGRSHFAEFVTGLADAKDTKDAAVLIGALRALGNQLREPRSKSLAGGLFELRGTRVRVYYGFFTGPSRGARRWLREETHRYAKRHGEDDAHPTKRGSR
jgi:hypothetical protein